MSAGPGLAALAALAFDASLHIDWGGHMDWDTGWRIAAMVGAMVFWLLVAAAAVWLAARALGGQR